jgi:hypothetical protein
MIMRIKLITFFAALLVAALARADGQSPVTVAVYDFTPTGTPVRDDGPKITALVTAELSSQPGLAMIERAQLTKALNEQALGLSGMVNSDVAAKIGQMTGAKILIAGQVFRTDEQHLVIIANIIGTETARMFAAKVEGGVAGDLPKLTSELSQKIARTISDQLTNLVVITEPREERIERIVKAVKGKNRPSVAVAIIYPRPAKGGQNRHSVTAEDEFGAILLKAGFTVVDDNSDHKPDVEINGLVDISGGVKRGNLVSSSAVIELKIQERRTGNIIAFDRQEASATDVGAQTASRTAQVNAVDGLAERVLPLLAQPDSTK